MQSRNKREGTYKAYRYGRHFRSSKALCKAAREFYGFNPWEHIASGF